jgi:hypothetical protein
MPRKIRWPREICAGLIEATSNRGEPVGWPKMAKAVIATAMRVVLLQILEK